MFWIFSGPVFLDLPRHDGRDLHVAAGLFAVHHVDDVGDDLDADSMKPFRPKIYGFNLIWSNISICNYYLIWL
jgi:hypothetical protein